MTSSATISSWQRIFGWQGLAGLMPEGLLSDLLKRDAGIQMFKTSFKTLFIRRAFALQSIQLLSTPKIGEQHDTGRYFLCKATSVIKCERFVQFYPKICRDQTEW